MITSVISSYKNEAVEQLEDVLFKLIVATGIAYLFGVGAAIYYNDIKQITALSVGIALLTVPSVLLKRGQVSNAGIIFTLLVIGTLTVTAMTGQGINDLAITAFPILYFFASISLNRAVFIICTICTLFAIFWLTFAELNGLFVPKPFQATDWVDFLIVAVVLLVAAVASDLLATMLRNNLERAENEINHRKQAEETLRTEKEFTEAALDSQKDTFFLFEPYTGKAIRWNRAFKDITGYTDEEIAEMPVPMSYCGPEDMERAKVFFQNIFGVKQHDRIDMHLICKDGRRVHFEYNISVINGENGLPKYMLSIGRDITEYELAKKEKMLLEQQLQQSQKQESLGQLSSGIAHDFNNILAAIIGYCNLTKINVQTAENNIAEIEKAAERAAGLCRQMMAYAGKAPITMTKVNMEMLVEEIVNMLKSTLPRNTVIKTEFARKIPIIKGDPSQMHQVVMNLIINASEAIGAVQGEVNVSLTRCEVLASKPLEDYNGKSIPPGEYVCLQVTDNGCGMDEETKWRLFEPFFTTKFTGRGLGMSAVLGIIKSHGGTIQLSSSLGYGTSFKVYIPVLADKITEDENRNSSTLAATWQGSGTILLVEDEEPIRFIAKTLLEMLQFTVLQAANGKEALEIYQNNAAEISLVFTDMGMPVMDGYELFDKLKQLKPDLPIIISSGYGDTEVKARLASKSIAGIVSKPYNRDKLRDVLKSVVEGL